jgi:uncharacterized protein YgfB (UPF0149 family)
MINDEYTRAVASLAAQLDAEEIAEWHGGITGCLCAVSGRALTTALTLLGPPGGDADVDAALDDQPSARQSLTAADGERVVVATERALAGDGLQFEPLLPDEAPLTERALALGAWCQGFLYGLATALPGVTERLQGEAKEAMHDFAELSLAVRGAEGAEEAENAYVELVEFVRVAVLLVFEELRASRRGETGAAIAACAGNGSADDAQ